MFKVLLVGESSVGKTSLLHTFITNTFQAHSSTIGLDYFTKEVELTITKQGKKKVVLQIWDTAGQEKYLAIQTLTSIFRGATGVIIVFSYDSLASLDRVDKWMTHVQNNSAEATKVLCVANKSDLIGTPAQQVTETHLEEL